MTAEVAPPAPTPAANGPEDNNDDAPPPRLNQPVGAVAPRPDAVSGWGSMAVPAETRVVEPAVKTVVASEPPVEKVSQGAASPEHPTLAVEMNTGAVWTKVQGAETKRSLRTLIQRLSPVSMAAGLAIIEVPADCMEIAKTNQRELEQLIASVSGKRTAIEFREQGVTRMQTGDRPAAPNSAFAEPAAPATAITDHPVVKRAAELFNARVISVQPRKRPAASVAAPTATSARAASSVQESPASTESGPSGDGQEDQERDQDTGDSD